MLSEVRTLPPNGKSWAVSRPAALGLHIDRSDIRHLRVDRLPVFALASSEVHARIGTAFAVVHYSIGLRGAAISRLLTG